MSKTSIHYKSKDKKIKPPKRTKGGATYQTSTARSLSRNKTKKV